MIVYTKLLKILDERNIPLAKVAEDCGCAPNTMTQFKKNRNVRLELIDKICGYLKVQPGDIMEWVPGDEALELEAQIETLQKKLNKMKNLE